MPHISFSVIHQFVTQVLVGILGLSFLVLIHEGGHFLAAKKFGVKVRTFAIGFGKTLFSFTRGETEYCIKAIPFGGFVAMEGEQPEDEKLGGPDEFSSKPIHQRMGIAFAGPAVNILFAFFMLGALYMWGIEEPVSAAIPVGAVEDSSPAFRAGIHAGDTITHMQGKKIEGIENFLQSMAPLAGKPTPITLQNNGVVKTVTVTPTMHKMGFAWTGIIPGKYHVKAASVLPGSAADKAGFKKDDRLVMVESTSVTDNNAFVQMIQSSQGKSLHIQIERDSVPREIIVAPTFDKGANTYRIGLQIQAVYFSPTHIVRRNFLASFQKSYETNVHFSKTIFVVLGGLFTGQIQLKALSGPVGILQVIGNSARKSFEDFVYFLTLISLNLGLMNLLPLIITDGGIILFLCIEAVRGKPLSTKVQMRINQVAISLFITLAVFITFHDVLRIPYFLN